MKEIVCLLDAGIIYPVKESEWVSPVHCVPKKDGFTVVPNENNELIPTRTIVRHRMCIDFRKLIKETRKVSFTVHRPNFRKVSKPHAFLLLRQILWFFLNSSSS